METSAKMECLLFTKTYILLYESDLKNKGDSGGSKKSDKKNKTKSFSLEEIKEKEKENHTCDCY